MRSMKLSATFLLSILLSAAVPSAWSADLLDAVRRGDHRAVRELLQNHADVNAAQPDGSTALVLAADREDAEVAGLPARAGGKDNTAKEYAANAPSLTRTPPKTTPVTNPIA